VDWLRAKARCAEISPKALESGDVEGALKALWALPERPSVSPTGIEEAANLLEPYLRG
jgi:hypothetical protein